MERLRCGSAWVLLVLAGGFLPAGSSPAAQEPGNTLACRFASYGKHRETAWEHLPRIGIHYVFMNVPSADEVESTRRRLGEAGLTPLVFRGDTDLSKENCVEDLAGQLRICRAMGVHYMFLSAKRRGAEKTVVYERLRRIGDEARKYGVVVALETHPDLGTNGDVQLETMKQVDHPNIRINFDTGNITFYNRNTDAVTELKKIIDYVATVELKDHNGEYMTWVFPPVGQGVVDMPEIIRILREHHYTGPITLEFEGTEGVELDENRTQQAIAESVAYIRSLGCFE